MSELSPGWLYEQMASARKDVELLGGSLDLPDLLAHAERQQQRIDRLQGNLDSLMAACQPLLTPTTR